MNIDATATILNAIKRGAAEIPRARASRLLIAI